MRTLLVRDLIADPYHAVAQNRRLQPTASLQVLMPGTFEPSEAARLEQTNAAHDQPP